MLKDMRRTTRTSAENIRGEGASNDMKGHYFTKLVTEQRRLRGSSWPRKGNLVVRTQPR